MVNREREGKSDLSEPGRTRLHTMAENGYEVVSVSVRGIKNIYLP